MKKGWSTQISNNYLAFIDKLKGRPQYANQKAYKSAVDKMSEAVSNQDTNTLQKMLHQMKTGRADSVFDDMSKEIWKTGDKVFHNKTTNDTFGISSEVVNKKKYEKL